MPLRMTYQVDGIVQERRNSSVLAMELRLSCINPSRCFCEFKLQSNSASATVMLYAILCYIGPHYKRNWLYVNFDTLRPEQNGSHFVGNIFKSIFLKPVFLFWFRFHGNVFLRIKLMLTHWGRDEMDAISQTTHSNAFSWMKMFEFRLKFHWNLFLWVQLTIFQY